MYLISACLCGVDCKYDGGNNKNKEVLKLLRKGQAVLVCPEQLGGLETPRDPSEIVEDSKETSVITCDGSVVTEQFLKGAKETLKIAKLMGIKKAILKERSPSCGSSEIYDGKFQKRVIKGKGITTRLLEENGVCVISEESLDLKN